MTCYHPIQGYKSRTVSPKTGKRSVVFNPRDGFIDMPVLVPCGQCIGCRLEKSRQWAIRCVHEATLHQENCFVTLTYNDENLPPNNSLDKEALTKFFKRVRKKYGVGIRYFACGEYGSLHFRPHYHVIFFGFKPSDLEPFKYKNGITLYRSAQMEKLWPFGFVSVGNVTFESCAYVSRYVLKKVTGDMAEEHYKGKTPEYIVMSRRPGIGRDWLEKYQTDVYNYDYVVIRNGVKCRPPKYYDNLYDKINPERMEVIKYRRKAMALANPLEKDYTRMEVKEAIQYIKVNKLVRGLEEEL